MYNQISKTMINQDFNSIIDLLKAFPDEQTCIDHLTQLRWNDNIVSPFDPASKVYTCKGNKYRCKNTGKYFNARTSTLFDNTKVALQKWFLAIWIVTSHKKGISSIQLSKDIDVTQKTAWFMLQRIRNCFGDEKAELSNEVKQSASVLQTNG
jgi:transposase-like protein